MGISRRVGGIQPSPVRVRERTRDWMRDCLKIRDCGNVEAFVSDGNRPNTKWYDYYGGGVWAQEGRGARARAGARRARRELRVRFGVPGVVSVTVRPDRYESLREPDFSRRERRAGSVRVPV
jgi:hypothetical protein